MDMTAYCVECQKDVQMNPITGDLKFCPECSRAYHMRSNLPIIRDSATKVYFSADLTENGVPRARLLTVKGELIEYVG